MTQTRVARLAIEDQVDVEQVQRAARTLGAALDFGRYEIEEVGLAVTELATNLLRHARGGEIEVVAVDGSLGMGIEVVSRDAGPGIADIDAALSDGFSTTGGLGGGLPGVRRLMDDFGLSSGSGGTIVHCRKWRTRA